MNTQDIKDLNRRGIALLRPTGEEWDAILTTREAGRRFSLHFPHKVAKAARRGGLILISSAGTDHALRIGRVRSVNATATLDSRVVVDLVSPVEPSSLDRLAAAAQATKARVPFDRLTSRGARLERMSEKLGELLIDVLAKEPANAPALSRILAHMREPTHFEDARALQRDAVSLAIKAFGGDDAASALMLPGDATAVATVRLQEDAVIEHDARWIPGWTLIDSDLTGRATFQKRGAKLDVFTANKRPLEQLFGVDLIYFNETRGALVMVQYKMLEPQERGRRTITTDMFDFEELDDKEWIVRIDDQFEDEMERMRRFDRDLDPQGPYRLNASAFFFKLVRRHASAKSAGMLLSLGHLDHLKGDGTLSGPKDGLRISYQSLDGHYLRSDPFVELIRSGYIGTRGATTDHLQALISASLEGGKAVVAGVQRALDPERHVT